MDYSPEDRRKAAEQLVDVFFPHDAGKRSGETRTILANAIMYVDEQQGYTETAKAAMRLQLQLNYALHLLEWASESTKHCDSSECGKNGLYVQITDFLADFPVPVETKR